MKILGNIILGLCIVIILFVCVMVYSLANINFMGDRDSVSVEASRQQMERRILIAESDSGSNRCSIELLDSSQIRIEAYGQDTSFFLIAGHKLSADTIKLLMRPIDMKEYVISDKLLIKDQKLLYRLDKEGNLDTTHWLDINFYNK